MCFNGRGLGLAPDAGRQLPEDQVPPFHGHPGLGADVAQDLALTGDKASATRLARPAMRLREAVTSLPLPTTARTACGLRCPPHALSDCTKACPWPILGHG
jgi:hypothetical protein